MILQSLVSYYEALAAKGEIAKPGWGTAKISYAIEIDGKGNPINLIPMKIEATKGKKTVLWPAERNMPEAVKRTVGVSPQFLWDNSGYMIGLSNKDNKKRDKECFEAAKKLHLEVLQKVDSECANAIKNYFVSWVPAEARNNSVLAPYIDEIIESGGNIVFSYKGKLIGEYSEIIDAWDDYRSIEKGGVTQQCLLTGKNATIARIHQSIKGVKGAQSSGAAIVSFNATAYESYGKVQSYNAPISEYAAFAYTTALNKLIADRDQRHTTMVGDTTVVYWAEDGESGYQDMMGLLLNPDEKFISDADLHEIMRKICSGQSVDFEGVELKPDNKFYILGLAPNASRISIRFFYADTFGNIVENVKKHFERLNIVKSATYKWLDVPLWKLLLETVNKHSQDKAASPLLAGAVLRSILTDIPYPMGLYQNIILRAKADHDDDEKHVKKISVEKAAIIKAVLQKNCHDEEVAIVALNKESNNVPYVLGRLFAVLEDLQNVANPGINSTIKDRYFNSACASPSVVFPLLIKLAGHHLKKLTAKPGLKINFNKKIGELQNKINMSEQPIPAHLSLEDQGRFILGYYHQVESRFNKEEE